MNWNLLVEWTSESGSGSWAQLRAGCAWLGSHGADERSPWSAAHRLACLGHLDIDWDSQRWSAPPPVLTMLPRSGGYAIAAGGRTRAFCDALATAAGNRDTVWLQRVT